MHASLKRGGVGERRGKGWYVRPPPSGLFIATSLPGEASLHNISYAAAGLEGACVMENSIHTMAGA